MGSTKFVGRRKELELLSEVLKHAQAGTAGVVVIAGEAGVGKTRLIRELAGVGHRADVRVLVGHCIPALGGELPYAPLVEALRLQPHELEAASMRELMDSAPAELVCLLSRSAQRPQGNDCKTTDKGLVRTRWFQFLFDLLSALAHHQPALLIMEDLQWADPPTLDFLTFLVRNLRHEAVAVVATYRAEELCYGHPMQLWLARLQHAGRVEHLDLQRLDQHETDEHLMAILGALPPTAVADNIFARSQGNPLYTERLALAAKGQQALPNDLMCALVAKLQACSRPARWVVNVAAAAGRRICHELLYKVAEIPKHQLTEAIREVINNQILVFCPEAGSYIFRHALIQEAAYCHLLPGERRSLHEALAQTLTDHPELISGEHATAHAELAHHWYAAANLPAALSAAVRAGLEGAQAHAFADALRHFEQALQLWDLVPCAQRRVDLDRAAVLTHAAEAARLAGACDRAVAFAQKALEVVGGGEPIRAGLLYERLGFYHHHLGDDATALTACDQAMRLIPQEPPSAARANVQVAVGRLSAVLAHHQKARALCEDALELARRVGAHATEGRALGVLGIVAAHGGDFGSGIRHLRASLTIAEETHDGEALAGYYLDLARLLRMAGRLPQAAQIALKGCEVVRRIGLEQQYGPMLKVETAAALFESGRWGQAARFVASAGRRSSNGLIGIMVLLELLRLSIARGDFVSAQRQAGRLTQLCRRVRSPVCHRRLSESKAELAVWQGRLDDAVAAVTEGFYWVTGDDAARCVGPLLMLGLRANADRAELARAKRVARDAAAAQCTGHTLLKRAGELGAFSEDPAASVFPERSVIAATCQAELSRLDGSSDPAAWASAATRWAGLRRPYQAAYARWREAEAYLVAIDTRRRAGPVLRQAHTAALRLGAKPLLQEIEFLARRARIDLQQRSAATHNKNDRRAEPSGLTTREEEVLKQIAAGRSNRQIAQALFISEKTVSVHVSHILRKLEAKNRVEAAKTAYRLGLIEASPSGISGPALGGIDRHFKKT